MARWVECAARYPERRVVLVNLEAALLIVPEEEGSLIVFPGGKETWLRVVESPADVLSKRPLENDDA